MIYEEMKAIIEKRKALDLHDEPSLINCWKQEIKYYQMTLLNVLIILIIVQMKISIGSVKYLMI